VRLRQQPARCDRHRGAVNEHSQLPTDPLQGQQELRPLRTTSRLGALLLDPPSCDSFRLRLALSVCLPCFPRRGELATRRQEFLFGSEEVHLKVGQLLREGKTWLRLLAEAAVHKVLVPSRGLIE
jgi:hypothetical protein